MEKTWFAQFLKGWKPTKYGPKPEPQFCHNVAFLGNVARKRPGYELMGAILAARPDGVTMEQYLQITQAAGPCANTIGDNGRNPFKNRKLMTVEQSRGPDGKQVYRMKMTALAQKLLAERDVPAAAQPVAKPAKAAKKVAKAGKKAGKKVEAVETPPAEALESIREVMAKVKINKVPAVKKPAKLKPVEKPLAEVLVETLVEVQREAAAEKELVRVQQLPEPPAEIVVDVAAEKPDEQAA